MPVCQVGGTKRYKVWWNRPKVQISLGPRFQAYPKFSTNPRRFLEQRSSALARILPDALQTDSILLNGVPWPPRLIDGNRGIRYPSASWWNPLPTRASDSMRKTSKTLQFMAQAHKRHFVPLTILWPTTPKGA
jgi:hypothetical protein